MNRTSNLFRQIVFIAGILNFPIGLMMIVPALLNPAPETLITTTVVGAFILFAGAALIWASRDLKTRTPIVVWNGLVRGFSVLIVSYTAVIGHVPVEQLVVTGLDLILAIIFTVGSVQITGTPFVKLVFASGLES